MGENIGQLQDVKVMIQVFSNTTQTLYNNCLYNQMPPLFIVITE